MSREKMTAVTKSAPCQVCGGDHKCSRGDGGLHMCGRGGSEVYGFAYFGPATSDPQFHLYRRKDDSAAVTPHRGGRRRAGKATPPPAPPATDRWGKEQAEYVKDLAKNSKRAIPLLAKTLGLPAEFLGRIRGGIGCMKDGGEPC